jgi:hypothetical protein
MRTQCANCRQSNAVSNRTLIVHTSSDDASVVSPSATSLGTAADASEPNAVQADAHTVPPECIQLEPPLHMKPPLAQCTLPQERLDSTVKQYQIPQKERTQETQHLFWFFWVHSPGCSTLQAGHPSLTFQRTKALRRHTATRHIQHTCMAQLPGSVQQARNHKRSAHGKQHQRP